MSDPHPRIVHVRLIGDHYRTATAGSEQVILMTLYTAQKHTTCVHAIFSLQRKWEKLHVGTAVVASRGRVVGAAVVVVVGAAACGSCGSSCGSSCGIAKWAPEVW